MVYIPTHSTQTKPNQAKKKRRCESPQKLPHITNKLP